MDINSTHHTLREGKLEKGLQRKDSCSRTDILSCKYWQM